jgi:nicotinate-nucleotide adenylyltransferase
MSLVLLYGGTFDPVHFGHVEMARGAIEQLRPAKLVLIPSGNPWQRGRLPFAAAEHRMAMLRLAFAGWPDVEIDTRELLREGPSYTFDTLTELHAESPATEFAWLIGSDAFARLDSWHLAAELPNLTSFAVAARAGEAIIAPGACPPSGFRILTLAPPAVSSTDLRHRLAKRQSIRGLAPDAVCDYIEHHKLYRPEETKH